MITLYVKGQELKVNQPVIASETIDYITAKVNFLTSDWDGLSKVVHFKQGDEDYAVVLDENNEIKADKHLNLSSGTYDVWIHGNDDNKRITTTISSVTVQKSGTSDGEAPIDVDLSVGEQILEKATNAETVANEVKQLAYSGAFDGNGIDRIEKISTEGLTDTYRIYFTNGETFDYFIKNGSNTGGGGDGSGIYGATATVDDNVGVPEVSVELKDGIIGFSFKNLKGKDGEKGETGATGANGADGVDGKAATIKVNSVQTGEAGTNAAVENVGTETDALLNFTIPRGLDGKNGENGADGQDGADGKAATIQIGKVETVSSDTPASVTNSGTENFAILDFSIPKGADGAGMTTVIKQIQGDSVQLENNTEHRAGELSSLTVTLQEEPAQDFISGLVFASGATATTLTMPESVVFSGDDVASGVLVPVSNKTYNCIVWYDGIQMNGVSRGVTYEHSV